MKKIITQQIITHAQINEFVNQKAIHVLLIEDYMADIRIFQETLKSSNIKLNLHYVIDGEQAIQYLKKEGKYSNVEEPDIILLDLNLPKKSGFEVLEEIKQDPVLKKIPIIVMTVSSDHLDVVKSYNLHANAYVVKPVSFSEFMIAVESIKKFWFTICKLPPKD